MARSACIAALACLSACSPTYVLRSSYEEARILWRREPIVEMLGDPGLDAATREKLRLVLVARDFAARLGLDVGGSYRTYSTIGPDQTIHVLSAAPRFRLEPYTWWFPFVGRMPYKGFWSETEATAQARELGAEGYDTIVLPVAAFSTLGWFDDPLLSNLLRHDDVVLANIVLHELTHNTWYAPGQAAFNESFANFVGGRGAIDLFAGLDGEEAPRTVFARQLWHDDLLYSAFLDRLATRLREAYAGPLTLERRDEIFREEQGALAQLPWQTRSYRGVEEVRLNNALVLHQWLYHRELSMFDAAWQAEGRDLPRTLEAIIAVAEKGGDAYARLGELRRPE